MRPLHIGLAAIGGKGWMGGANYVRNLAAAITAAAPDTRISWFCGDALAPEWRVTSAMHVLPKTSPLARWLGLEKRAFRRALEHAGIDFVYPLTYDNSYNLGLEFPISGALGRVAWAGWIPDFQHRYLPELFSEDELRWRDRQMSLLATEARRVVLSSRTAMADFERFLPEHASKAALLTFRVAPVAPHTASPEVAGEFAAPERFFLVCNQFWRHKNHLVLFEALKLLHARGVRPPVLCTGALSDYRSDPYVASLQAILAESGFGEQVRLLGLIPREQQVSLMRRAIAIIQPSLFEGWSTVVEDARAFGRPTILSDLPVHREQCPPRAIFFNPRSAEELAERIGSAWAELPAGPDPDAEAAAHALAKEQQQTFGRDFLRLAESLR